MKDMIATEISPDITVGELVVRTPQLRPQLEQMGIDYCCGGKQPLLAAVEAAGLEWATVIKTLDAAAHEATADDTAWNQVSLSRLVDHIVETHHAFMKDQLPRLDGLLAKVQKAHSSMHGDMLTQLRRAFDAIRSELEAHLMKEEQILFPLIRQTDAFMNDGGQRPVSHCGSVANPIRQMEVEHDDAGNELAIIRKLTDGYQLPIDACPTFEALYDGLQAMEDDLHEHIHKENNILFPKSIEQEAEMARQAR